MEPISVYKVAKTVACHCWNKDRTQIALATRNSNTIQIYSNCASSKFEDWKLVHTLSGHDLPITSLDWDPNFNRILTCSEDCNAYVWNWEEGTWIPTLVLLKIKRAALCCRWSPDGRSFAVGSSERKLRICTFNTDQNLWVNPSGLHAKLERENEAETGSETPTVSNKSRGSIFCICWDRTGQLLCRGSLDGSMSIVSTYYDPSQPIQECPFDITSKDLFGFVFGDKCDVVESIAVSLNNTVIAYADRSSDVHVLEFTGHAMRKQTVHCPSLPFTSLLFVRDDVIVGGGYDGDLHVLSKQSDAWEYRGVADLSSAGGRQGMSSSFKERINKLQSGMQSKQVKNNSSPHQNMILEIREMQKTGNVVTKISSCGLDGRIVVWNMEVVLKNMNL